MSTRRKAREIALQAFYSYEFTQYEIKNIISCVLIENDEKLEDNNFSSELLNKCLENIEDIDECIKGKLENWDFRRIAIIDKIVLRLAITELLYFEDIPPKVTIDEAIEIAKKYSTEKSGSFVNGILNAIYKDLNKKGKLVKSGRGLIDKSQKEMKEIRNKKY